MKILLVTDTLPPERTTVGTIAMNLAHKLVEEGNAVSIFSTTRDKSLVGHMSEGDIDVFRIYSDYHLRFRSYVGLYNPSVVRYFRRILKEIQPDIVHFHNIHTYVSYHSLLLAKRSGAKVFLTAHDAMLFHHGKPSSTSSSDSWLKQLLKYKTRFNPCRNLIIKFYLRFVDRIFAVSYSLKGDLNKNGIGNIEVIHNGLDLDTWDVDEKSVLSFINKHQLQGKRTILFGGRLSEEKGGCQAILVLQEIVKTVPEACLVVMGNRNEYANEMLRLSEELDLKDNVVFTGFLSKGELKSAYNASDLVIMPSLYREPFGMICLEAMASKKPVVATSFGGPKEIVEDGVTGYIVNFLDIGLVAEKILDLLSHSDKLAKFGQSGYVRLNELFTMDMYTHKVLAGYHTLNKQRLPISTHLFLRFYMLLHTLRITRIPRVKGLFYQVYRRLGGKRGIFSIKTTNGIKLYIDLRDSIVSAKLLQYGFWEEGLTKLVVSVVKPGMNIVDAGAHVGYYSTLFAKLTGPSGKVFAFEPEPHNFSLLKENCLRNNFDNLVLENKAVFNQATNLKMKLHGANLGAHTVMDKDAGDYIQIESIVLDKYIQDKGEKVDLMKLDIEGAEESALEGAINLIKDNPDIKLIVEFKPINKSILRLLRSYGFRVFVVGHTDKDLQEFTDDLALIQMMQKVGHGLVNLFCTR